MLQHVLCQNVRCRNDPKPAIICTRPTQFYSNQVLMWGALVQLLLQLPHHFLVMGNYPVALPKISAAEAEQQRFPVGRHQAPKFKRSKEKPLLSCSMYYFESLQTTLKMFTDKVHTGYMIEVYLRIMSDSQKTNLVHIICRLYEILPSEFQGSLMYKQG